MHVDIMCSCSVSFCIWIRPVLGYCCRNEPGESANSCSSTNPTSPYASSPFHRYQANSEQLQWSSCCVTYWHGQYQDTLKSYPDCSMHVAKVLSCIWARWPGHLCACTWYSSFIHAHACIQRYMDVYLLVVLLLAMVWSNWVANPISREKMV